MARNKLLKVKRKKKFDLEPIKAKGCAWMWIIGMRSNGKSFEAKYEAIERAYKEGKKFIYCRRWDTDIKAKYVDAYFDDMKEASNGYKAVEDITGGEWQGVYAYQGYIYLYRDTEEGRERSKDPIGRYVAVNIAQRFKSQAFINYGTFIFEEVLTNKIYIDDEPAELMQLISTVFRDEDEDVRIYLIANTISRVCPYFTYFGLNKIPDMKPGQIDVYSFSRMDGETVQMAVQNTDVIKTKSKLFFGQSEKSIQGGEWETKETPRLPKPLDYYEKLYRVLVDYDNFRFKLLLLGDNDGGLTVYIYPFTSDRKPKKYERVITDKYSTSPMITPALEPKRNIPEAMIIDCFRRGKVAFSDNLTGADFTNLTANYDMGV